MFHAGQMWLFYPVGSVTLLSCFQQLPLLALLRALFCAIVLLLLGFIICNLHLNLSVSCKGVVLCPAPGSVLSASSGPILAPLGGPRGRDIDPTLSSAIALDQLALEWGGGSMNATGSRRKARTHQAGLGSSAAPVSVNPANLNVNRNE